MSSLQVILSEKAKLMEEVAAQFGEVTDEQLQVIQELDITIPAKIDSWALFLKETIPEQIQSFKNKIEEYREGIKKLELFKEKKELYLHNLLKGNNLEEINGEEKRIVPDLSVRRSVSEDYIPDEHCTLILPTIGWGEYDELLEIADNTQNNLLKRLTEQAKHKVNVTDLPENHPAIVKSIRNTVKILKAKK
jgi:hypothetical protein